MTGSFEDIKKVKEAFRQVSSYTGDCDDWVAIKKQVLLTIPSELRKLFSTRDSKTKEQSLNNFEKQMIIYYKDTTGIDLILRTLAERRELFDVL